MATENATPSRQYMLTFKHRAHLGTKVFMFPGTLNDAISRSQEHCRRMGYVFVLVRPFLVDLDHQERLKLEDPAYTD